MVGWDLVSFYPERFKRYVALTVGHPIPAFGQLSTDDIAVIAVLSGELQKVYGKVTVPAMGILTVPKQKAARNTSVARAA